MTGPLPIGFTSFAFGHGPDIRIYANTYTGSNGNISLDVHTWDDTLLYNATTNWLDVLAFNRDFQYGSFNSTGESSTLITFPIPFATVPNVVVWLNGFDLGLGLGPEILSYRMRAYPISVTTTSFVLVIQSWSNTLFYGASAYWMAVPSDQRDITSGSFTTQQIRSWTVWTLNNQLTVKFNHPFISTPRVVAALNGLDNDGGADITAKVTITDVNTTHFTWHLDGWNNTIFYDAWASYIAAIDLPPKPSSSYVGPMPYSSNTHTSSRVGAAVGITIGALIILGLSLYLLYRRYHRTVVPSSSRTFLRADEVPVVNPTGFVTTHPAQHRNPTFPSANLQGPVTETSLDTVEQRLLTLQTEVTAGLAQIRAQRMAAHTNNADYPVAVGMPQGYL